MPSVSRPAVITDPVGVEPGDHQLPRGGPAPPSSRRGKEEGVLHRERGVGRTPAEHERGGRCRVSSPCTRSAVRIASAPIPGYDGGAHRAPAATTTDWASTSAVVPSTSTVTPSGAQRGPPGQHLDPGVAQRSRHTTGQHSHQPISAIRATGGGPPRRPHRARRETPTPALQRGVDPGEEHVGGNARPMHARPAQPLGLGQHDRRPFVGTRRVRRRTQRGRRRQRPRRRCDAAITPVAGTATRGARGRCRGTRRRARRRWPDGRW